MAIAWLANPDERNLAQVIQDLGQVWEEVKADGDQGDRLLVAARGLSAGPTSRRSPAWTKAGGAELIDTGHALLRELGQNRVSTIAAVKLQSRTVGVASSPWPAIPHRRGLGRLRPARDQPRDHPRLRRHAEAAEAGAGLRRPSK